MSNRRTLMAAAAIALALVAGIGVYVYASNADKRAEDNAGFVNALVADADIAKGTTGSEVVQAGLVHEEKVAKSSVPASIVTNVNDLVGKVAAARLDSKQFITQQTFVSEDVGTGGQFANAINCKDCVAMTVSVDADRGVANQIEPGDHVNIAVPINDSQGNNVGWTYLLTKVKVLAVGASVSQSQQQTSSDSSSADGSSNNSHAGSGVLTFEVSQADALRVIAANSGNSKIYLVLLPPDASTSTTGGTKAPSGK